MVQVYPLSIVASARFPLPLYTSIPVGRIVSDDGEQFSLVAGLTAQQVAELRTKSLDESDELLQKNTSDKTRFGGENSYDEWYAKGRLPIAMIDSNGSLAALAWYGPQALPDDSEFEIPDRSGEWDTAGYRSYGEYRGKGLMTPFIEFTLQMHQQLFPKQRIWIETNEDNIAGRKVFGRSGFKEYGKRPSNGRILMIKE
jgi:RimJ/RimL family protein N-acetyltransferase